MKPIRIFDIVYKRKIAFFGFAIGLIVIASVVLSANFFGNSRKAKAVEFEANENSLVVPENTLLYIGATGYVSQRLFSSTAEPLNPSHQISNNGISFPVDHVYHDPTSSQQCWADAKTTWGNNFTNCVIIAGDGTGMILKYNQKIDIYGTVVIGDRVVFDSPNINIHRTGKIYANGQDNQLGAAEYPGPFHCGTGGIGGINGGTNANNLLPTAQYNGMNFVSCRGVDTQGGPSTDPNFLAIKSQNINVINSDVEPYFVANNVVVTGGNGSKSSLPLTSDITPDTPAADGAPAAIGVGGGGGGGTTGSSSSDIASSSGGGGGGFGLVLKSNTLNINSYATITAAGGDSSVDPQQASQYFFPSPDESPSGAFGGPGGGGVIIINSSSIQFRSGSNNESEALADYSIFNTKAGTFAFPENYYVHHVIDDGELKVPPGALDGKLVVNAGSGIVSVRKSVTNITAGTSGRPNYVFRSGDTIQITLYVTNLAIGQLAQVRDELFSDVAHTATVVDPGGGTLDNTTSPPSIYWNLPAANATSKTLIYTIRIN